MFVCCRYEIETDESRINIANEIGLTYLGFNERQDENQTLTNNKKDGAMLEIKENVDYSGNDKISDVLNDDILKKCFENRYGKLSCRQIRNLCYVIFIIIYAEQNAHE